MLRKPDKGTFESHLTTITVPYVDMVRLSTSPSTEPYWAKRANYRFDDPTDPKAGPRFGVLYVADLLSTAFSESIIHEHAHFANGRFEVSVGELNSRQPTRYTHPTKTALTLVDFTGAALKKLGLNNDLSSGDDYAIPQQWSKAVHDAQPIADGIRYVSRQNNASCCYALFDRSGMTAGAYRPLSDLEKATLCKLFNVVPV
jgi:hypothetical protein